MRIGWEKSGTPEDVATIEASHTGRFLKPMLGDTAPGTGHNTSGDKRDLALPPKKEKPEKKKAAAKSSKTQPGTRARKKTSS